MSQAALQFRRLNLEIAALRQQIRDPHGFPTEQQRAIAMNKVTALNRQHNHLLSMLNTTGTGVGLSDVPHLQPGMLGQYGQPNYGVDRMGVYRGGQSYGGQGAQMNRLASPLSSPQHVQHEPSGQSYGGQGAQMNQRQEQLVRPLSSPQHVQHEPSDSPEITAADFEAIDRVEKALNEENQEAEPAEVDNDDQPDLVAVETEFSEKDMLCPYSAKVMQTPMKSKSCGHRLDRESLKALIDYFNSKQKELGRKNKPSQSSNCPIYGCKGLWTHKGSVIDKELRTKIQNFQKNRGINSLGSSGNPGGAPAGASSTAATATATAAAAAGGNGRKRKAPEVLDLCSDSESEDAQPRPEPPTASAAAPAVTSASSSSSPSASGAAMPLQPSIQSQDGATTREASPSVPSSSTPNGNPNAIGRVPVSGSSSSRISTTNGVAVQSPLRAFHTSELREELLKEKALTKQLTAERKSLEGFITKRKSAKTKAQNKLDETGKLQQQLQTAREDNQILQNVVLGLQEFVKAAKERDSNNNEDVY